MHVVMHFFHARLMREFTSMSMSIMHVRKRASSYVAPSSSLAEANPTPANESHSSDTVDATQTP